MKMNKVTSAIGAGGRMLALRVHPEQDMISAVKEACKKHNVKYGVILAGIGSLRSTTFKYVVPRPDMKVGAGYRDEVRIKGPTEILSLSGNITEMEDGSINVHLHGAICDEFGKIHGGHLEEGGNEALYTAEIIIEEVKDMKLLRKYDPEVDAPAFAPEAIVGL